MAIWYYERSKYTVHIYSNWNINSICNTGIYIIYERTIQMDHILKRNPSLVPYIPSLSHPRPFHALALRIVDTVVDSHFFWLSGFARSFFCPSINTSPNAYFIFIYCIIWWVENVCTVWFLILFFFFSIFLLILVVLAGCCCTRAISDASSCGNLKWNIQNYTTHQI